MSDVVVLGSNGMLGWMATNYLSNFHRVLALPRERFEVSHNWPAMEWSLNYELLKYGKPDYIINCIGAIKPAFDDQTRWSTNNMVNSVFPWLLANYARDHAAKLVHITTDCVFDGYSGYYTEKSPHSPTDAYGRSKSLGEPDNCMNLRTSIIGPEKNTKKSLVEWLLSNAGGKVDGFQNHIWNGLTTLEFAKALEIIIREDLFEIGTFHIFSNDITKYDMLRTMNEAWSLEIEVSPKEAKQFCNRTLRTVYGLNSTLQPGPFVTMIEELREYINDRYR